MYIRKALCRHYSSVICDIRSVCLNCTIDTTFPGTHNRSNPVTKRQPVLLLKYFDKLSKLHKLLKLECKQPHIIHNKLLKVRSLKMWSDFLIIE